MFFIYFSQRLYVVRIIIHHDVKYYFKVNCCHVNYKNIILVF